MIWEHSHYMMVWNRYNSSRNHGWSRIWPLSQAPSMCSLHAGQSWDPLLLSHAHEVSKHSSAQAYSVASVWGYCVLYFCIPLCLLSTHLPVCRRSSTLSSPIGYPSVLSLLKGVGSQHPGAIIPVQLALRRLEQDNEDATWKATTQPRQTRLSYLGRSTVTKWS